MRPFDSIEDENTPTSTLTISFATEHDRVKGFAELIRSNVKFDGIGKNEFKIQDVHIKIFKEKNIKFTKI